MKTFIYLVGTSFIFMACFYGALNAKHPLVLYAVGFAVLALFVWGCSRRAKKSAEKRSGEKLFQDYMRAQMRNFRR